VHYALQIAQKAKKLLSQMFITDKTYDSKGDQIRLGVLYRTPYKTLTQYRVKTHDYFT